MLEKIAANYNKVQAGGRINRYRSQDAVSADLAILKAEQELQLNK